MVVHRQLGVKIAAAPGAGDGVEQMPVRREDNDVVRAGLEPLAQSEVWIQLPVGDNPAHLAKPFQILSQEDSALGGCQVRGLRLIHFGAEDGADAGLAGGLLEGYRAVQAVGIREGHGGAGQAPDGRDQSVDAIGAGEKGIVTVAV